MVATLDDYKAVRTLVVDVISDQLEAQVSPETRETVESVNLLGGPYVTYAELAKHLKLDRSAVSRRARVAIERGYLRNLEDKRGKPVRLVLDDPLPGDLRSVRSPRTCSTTRGVHLCTPTSTPPPPK